MTTNMDNRALLEKAAKAMGYQWSKNTEITHDGLWITEPSVKTYWNPLKHNSYALEIATTLGLSIVHYPLRKNPREFVTVQIHRMGDLFRETPVQHTEPYHGDPVAATRRAIVCCAAAFYDLQEGIVSE